MKKSKLFSSLFESSTCKACVFSLVFFLATQLSAQVSVDSVWSPEKIVGAVVYLKVVVNRDTIKGGSGTIVEKNSRFYLITAAHLAKFLDFTSEMYFSVKGDKPFRVAFPAICRETNIPWVIHPIADLALLELKPTSLQLSNLLKGVAFPYSLIHITKEPIPRSFDLMMFGYPILDQVGEYFSPISVRSKFSSGLMTAARADTHTYSTFYYLQNPSMAGTSGGPVFEGVDQSGANFGTLYTLLVGVVHGTIGDTTGGKFAMITPTFYIAELFDQIK